MKEENKLDKIVSLCKRRGFVFQGSEIYGGLAGFWDYGHYGVTLKNNIKSLWWKMFVEEREDMYGVDAAIIMNPKAWKASGHVSGFTDQMDDGKKFNVMFKTSVGAGDTVTESFLRPETAGGMFVNFKNIIDSFAPKLPFGLGQVGKAFRNEIAPRDFIFRSREFEQMEVEYFVPPKDWERYFDEWKKVMHKWCEVIGLNKSHLHELEVPDSERAHYSKRTIDFEFDYPFGRKELYGLAYRTDFDLISHSALSNADLSFCDEETGEKFIPHVIEPSLGVDRTVLAVLCDSYQEDEMGGEKRIYLALKPALAPVKVAVFPLLKNKPQLVKRAREIYGNLRQKFGAVEFDDNGNIGKRYRRQDEIGTPYCVTVDFNTLEGDGSMTVRDRDSGKQERVSEKNLNAYISERISL